MFMRPLTKLIFSRQVIIWNLFKSSETSSFGLPAFLASTMYLSEAVDTTDGGGV